VRLTGAEPGRKIGPLERDLTASPHEVTELLQAWSEGDVAARDRLFPLIYQELRRRAAAYLRRERRGHILQPTALVNEAYLRLVDQQRAAWQNRSQFLAVASQMMRRILVDRARAKRMAKRSGRWARVTLDDMAAVARPADVDVLDLDTALTRLAEFDPRKSHIAELRFFGGLSLQETAETLGVSLATVERDWQAARAWLFKTLSAP
jgi:RNA polymerase sigma factor (TIGR02999 family)